MSEQLGLLYCINCLGSHRTLYTLVIGAILPLPFWFWQRQYPNGWIKYISTPVILNGVSAIPPATGINYSSSVLSRVSSHVPLASMLEKQWKGVVWPASPSTDGKPETCVEALAAASSTLHEIGPGTSFPPVLQDPTDNTSSAKRVVLMTGKIYDLLKEQQARSLDKDVAFIQLAVPLRRTAHVKGCFAPLSLGLATARPLHPRMPRPGPPIFFFVVDTCLDEEDLKALHDALISQVHKIGYAECNKSYVFRGAKEHQPKQIQDMLGLSSQSRAAPRPGQPMPQQSFGASRFLLPVQQCEFQLTGILEGLTRDPWPVADDKCPLRCSGVVLSVTMGLLETTYPNTGVRIMLFAGGPATEGPGMVVSNELKEPIRSRHNIDRDSVKHFKRATKVRLLEMKSLPNSTNGVIVLSDAFTTSIFKQNFLCLFNKDDQGHLQMGFNATFDVQTTKELKVSGLIGHTISAGSSYLD
ncbi:hypothetical protein K438DRAFT_1987069 [Mycena galopus ATCC 62051]|nr:hypothetical protein K438DRAFT_1987069 [Mycena galopus ATCC 62051]